MQLHSLYSFYLVQAKKNMRYYIRYIIIVIDVVTDNRQWCFHRKWMLFISARLITNVVNAIVLDQSSCIVLKPFNKLRISIKDTVTPFLEIRTHPCVAIALKTGKP